MTAKKEKCTHFHSLTNVSVILRNYVEGHCQPGPPRKHALYVIRLNRDCYQLCKLSAFRLYHSYVVFLHLSQNVFLQRNKVDSSAG